MNKKEQSRQKRHKRIKMNMYGTKEKPRLVVHRSLKNISVQLIDDTENRELYSFSTKDKQIKEKFPAAGNIKATQFFGEIAGGKIKEKGFAKIVFDRAGYLYHGRVKALAEGLRKGGLEF